MFFLGVFPSGKMVRMKRIPSISLLLRLPFFFPRNEVIPWKWKKSTSNGKLGGGNSYILYVHPYLFGEGEPILTFAYFGGCLPPPTRNSAALNFADSRFQNFINEFFSRQQGKSAMVKLVQVFFDAFNSWSHNWIPVGWLVRLKSHPRNSKNSLQIHVETQRMVAGMSLCGRLGSLVWEFHSEAAQAVPMSDSCLSFQVPFPMYILWRICICLLKLLMITGGYPGTLLTNKHMLRSSNHRSIHSGPWQMFRTLIGRGHAEFSSSRSGTVGPGLVGCWGHSFDLM